MQFGMISYYIPLERYPDTYNGQPLGIASLANQKRHMPLYLMGIYANDYDAALVQGAVGRAPASASTSAKSCVRFRKLDDVALDVIGEAIARTSAESSSSPPTRRAAPASRG